MKRTNNKILLKWTLAITLTVALCVGGCAVYLSDYYRADAMAIEAFTADNAVNKSVISDKIIAYGNADADVGFIFYPGGKVDYLAYEPLLSEIASKGALCVLIKMPFNLAVLDINAANGVCELFPQIKSWYIGGHSLGGSMAASYLANNIEEFDGLILLGSYSTADLSKSAIDALSLYGSEDKVMNAEKYQKYKANLPHDFTEIIIPGGCHAYFGMYGSQEGDGIPTISVEEQICQTALYIAQFVVQTKN